MRPTFYRGCWHVVSRHFFLAYRPASSARKALYDPKAFLGHAALLRQASAHCAISLTAASRRSRARLSVPVWGTTLSGPLPVYALVSRYLANQLMGRRPLPGRIAPFHTQPLTSVCLWGISIPFETLSPRLGQVAYVLLTRSPLGFLSLTTKSLVRLACIRHAASVHPEPGSNSSYVT